MSTDAWHDIGQVLAQDNTGGRPPTGRHPRNAQTLVPLELGPVGAVVALCFAWPLIRRLENLSTPARVQADGLGLDPRSRP